MIADNGPQFHSDEFRNFLAEHNIELKLSSVFNPQENELVERWNRTLKEGVQAFIASGQRWETGLSKLLLQYRGLASHDQPSPAERMFSRKI